MNQDLKCAEWSQVREPSSLFPVRFVRSVVKTCRWAERQGWDLKGKCSTLLEEPLREKSLLNWLIFLTVVCDCVDFWDGSCDKLLPWRPKAHFFRTRQGADLETGLKVMSRQLWALAGHEGLLHATSTGAARPGDPGDCGPHSWQKLFLVIWWPSCGQLTKAPHILPASSGDRHHLS